MVSGRKKKRSSVEEVTLEISIKTVATTSGPGHHLVAQWGPVADNFRAAYSRCLGDL